MISLLNGLNLREIVPDCITTTMKKGTTRSISSYHHQVCCCHLGDLFMYLNDRAILVRNLSVAAVNGVLTYIILIIAPLGLMAVIINTALVTLATYFTATAADRVVRYLSRGRSPSTFQAGMPTVDLQQRQSSDLDRFE
jgi:hypothetical protein